MRHPKILIGFCYREAAWRGFAFPRRRGPVAIRRSNAGFSFAMASNRKAELCGLREPCSQLRTVPMLVQRNSANSGWLSRRRRLTRRICAGLISRGGKARRETRSLVFRPDRCFFASVKPDNISSNRFLFISPPSVHGRPSPIFFSVPRSGRLVRPCRKS